MIEPTAGDHYIWRRHDLAPKEVVAVRQVPDGWLFDYGSTSMVLRQAVIPLDEIHEADDG